MLASVLGNWLPIVGLVALMVLTFPATVWLQNVVARDVERRGGDPDAVLSGLWWFGPIGIFRWHRLRRTPRLTREPDRVADVLYWTLAFPVNLILWAIDRGTRTREHPPEP